MRRRQQWGSALDGKGEIVKGGLQNMCRPDSCVGSSQAQVWRDERPLMEKQSLNSWNANTEGKREVYSEEKTIAARRGGSGACGNR